MEIRYLFDAEYDFEIEVGFVNFVLLRWRGEGEATVHIQLKISCSLIFMSLLFIIKYSRRQYNILLDNFSGCLYEIFDICRMANFVETLLSTVI